MRRRKVKELLEHKGIRRAGCVLISAMVLGVGAWAYQDGMQGDIPELTTFVDLDEQITVGEEEVPLSSAPKVKISTQKTKKVVTLKKKSSRTYTKKKKPRKTVSPTVTESVGDTVTTVKKETTINVTEKYKKNSKKKTVITVKKIKTITTEQAVVSGSVQSGETSASGSQIGNNVSLSPYTVSVTTLAPKLDGRVMDAYQKLGFDITINGKASYTGYFNARNQNITLREESDTVYHEMGHFVAFVAGNIDTKPEFAAVYQAEKNSFHGSRKVYASQNASEFFAEAFREYTLNPGALKSACPNTFDAITKALAKVTDAQISQIKNFYGAIWTK